MIKAVLFDYFGVISSYDGWEIEPVDDLMPEIPPVNDVEAAWWRYCYAVAEHKGVKPSEVDQDHKQHSVNRRLVAYIFILKQSYKVGLLSNLNKSYARPLIESMGMDILFDAIVVSSEIAHAKPHPDAYIYALDQLGVAPQEAIFVDDGMHNVQGAKEVGMHGVLFKDFNSLRSDVEILTSL